MTDFGMEHSYAAACARFREHYGFDLPKSAVRSETMRHAQRASHRLAAQYEQPFTVLPAHGAPVILAEADGTMVCTVEPGARKAKRPRQWQELRLAVAKLPGAVSATYGATFGDVADTGRRWGHCAKEAGWGMDSQIHVVADGAEWLWRQSREVFGAQGRFLVDFFHLSEYLSAASESCSPKTPRRWLKVQQARLKRSVPALVLEALEPFVEPPSLPDEEAPVRRAARYLSNRIDCVDYRSALEQNLPIGSGLIESGHRHVLHSRLKRAGTAWLKDSAHSMAQLRVLRANGQWDEFWTRPSQLHPLQEAA
jgi:hypothetical protein